MIQNEKIETHLKSVDILELINRIKHFRSLNIKDLSDNELFEEINKVLLWNDRFNFLILSKFYSANTNFFRVRKLSGSVIPIDNFKTVSDMWEPPSNVLKTYGRLNKPYESLLYVALEPLTAVRETHIKENDFYAVIKYKAIKDIKVVVIGDDYDYSVNGITDKHAITVHEIYNNFFKDEFSRDVGIGTEYLYRISEQIAKSYFDYPPREFQDAWAYCSVQDKTKYNVCFRPDIAHELLELQGAMICKKDNTDNINVRCIAKVDNNGKLNFFYLGTPEQKEIFPEIVLNNNIKGSVK